MRARFLLCAVAAAAMSCADEQPRQVVEMQTIETVPLQAVPPSPDPTLEDFVPEVPLPLEPVIPEDEQPDGTTTDTTTTNPDANPAVKTREQISIRLPFAPAIAMDPVDGQKVSITPQTPTAEYKGRIYYFNDASNRAAFVRSPQQYLTGPFAAY